MKKVLLVTQYFYPENFKGNDIAFELVKRGYEVDALVSIPNYPEGKYYKGYGIFRKRKEVINGVNVYRAFQIPRGKGGLRLMLTYISYAICASFDALFLCRKKYDCIFVQQLSPVFQVYPAILLKKIKKIPLYMWVLDIWPDAMKSGGGIKNKKIIEFIDFLVKRIYDNCDKILVSSRKFAELIALKGDYNKKIEYFPNWSEDILTMKQDFDIPKLPKGFKIMIAGNLGIAQNLDSVAEAMLLMKEDKDVKWIFVGDGARRSWLEQFIKDNDLEDTAFTLGRFPFSAMPAFYKEASAMLVTLKAGYPHLEAVVPARLQSYMSAGRPVLAMIGCGGADIISDAGCGFAAPPSDAATLVQIIRSKVLPHKDEFEEMGHNGRKYYESNFTVKMCMDHLEEIINN